MLVNLAKWPRLYYVRHGQSLRNVGAVTHRDMPTWEVGMTEVGHAQVGEAGEWLAGQLLAEGRVSRVRLFSGLYRRAKQTAEILAQHLREAEITFEQCEDVRLHEHGTGYYEYTDVLNDAHAQHVKELAIQLGVYHYFVAPGGESLIDAAQRQLAWLERIDGLVGMGQLGPDDTVIISGHAVTGRLMRGLVRQEQDLLAWYQANMVYRNGGVWCLREGVDQGFVFGPTVETQ